MTPDLIRDYADNVAHERPELLDSVHRTPSLYSGKGNPCARVIITFEASGISRDQRLRFVASIFQLKTLVTLKDLSAAQLMALDHFRDLLKELYAAY